jgi:ribosomal protein L3 glutamine methyltransferase
MTFSPISVIALVQEHAAQLAEAQLAFGHGTQSAHDEAAWLVLWRLGLPLDTELEDPQLPLVGAHQQSQINELIAQRISTRKPAAYLTREAWLQGIAFYCDERSIVPRSLIAELLADGTLDAWLSDKTRQVLDLCTGNGSLAVLAAMAYPEVEVTGADISSDALAVAHINVVKHDLMGRIRLVQSDGLEQVPGRFDLVLCNPPYVNSNSMAQLPPEYRAEPELALAGGCDGMDFVRKLLPALPAHLHPQAVLVLEIGNEKAYFESAFPNLPVVWLDTSAGDEQVLLIEQADLVQAFPPAAPSSGTDISSLSPTSSLT